MPPGRSSEGKAANQARYDALREQLNLDRPVYEQYVDWLAAVTRADLGESLVQQDTKVTSRSRTVCATLRSW